MVMPVMTIWMAVTVTTFWSVGSAGIPLLGGRAQTDCMGALVLTDSFFLLKTIAVQARGGTSSSILRQARIR